MDGIGEQPDDSDAAFGSGADKLGCQGMGDAEQKGASTADGGLPAFQDIGNREQRAAQLVVFQALAVGLQLSEAGTLLVEVENLGATRRRRRLLDQPGRNLAGPDLVFAAFGARAARNGHSVPHMGVELLAGPGEQLAATSLVDLDAATDCYQSVCALCEIPG